MKDWSAEDRAHRERLERQASVGERADLGRIVAMATCDALASRSLEGSLGKLRKMAQAGTSSVAAAGKQPSVSPDVIGVEDMSRLARQAWRNRFF